MKSIMQTDKKCYITGETSSLHKHHIFGGANRRHSEKYGLWVWLRADWHTGTNYSVHHDSSLMQLMREMGQRTFERTHTRLEFTAIFGRNYIDDC